jgi:multiple sugar transport system substrate-binding protein
MSHRLLTTIVVITLSIMALGACGSSETAEVSFMVFGDPEELAAYQTLVEAFEATHEDIDIDLQHVPSQSEYRQRLAAAFSAGEPPDVMLINYRRMAVFADQGGLEPLTEYLAGSDLLSEPEFFPAAIESFQWNEELWCIPQNVSSLAVYYNRELFDQAGLPYPADNWTWPEFLATAQALTQDTDGDGQTDQYGVGLQPILFRLAPFIWQNGGRLVDDETNPTRLALDEPAAMDAFQWFVELQTKHGVVPDSAAEAAESSESRFLNGTLAMIFNSRRGVPTYRTIESFEWDVAALPQGRREAGILHSDGYCMAAAAQDKDAAWTFIEYANAEAGQSIIARTGRTVPSLIAVAESEAFLDPAAAPANSRVFTDALLTLKRVPIMSNWVAIEETVDAEVERAFYGQVSVAEAVVAALERTAKFFEEDTLRR